MGIHLETVLVLLHVERLLFTVYVRGTIRKIIKKKVYAITRFAMMSACPSILEQLVLSWHELRLHRIYSY